MRTQRMVILLTILFTTILGFISYFYLRSTFPTEQDEDFPSKAITVPFQYEVISLTQQEILMRGQKGNLHLPNNSQFVEVFKGTLPSAQPAALADLTVGQKVKLLALPGDHVWVYIIQ